MHAEFHLSLSLFLLRQDEAVEAEVSAIAMPNPGIVLDFRQYGIVAWKGLYQSASGKYPAWITRSVDARRNRLYRQDIAIEVSHRRSIDDDAGSSERTEVAEQGVRTFEILQDARNQDHIWASPLNCFLYGRKKIQFVVPERFPATFDYAQLVDNIPRHRPPALGEGLELTVAGPERSSEIQYPQLALLFIGYAQQRRKHRERVLDVIKNDRVPVEGRFSILDLHGRRPRLFKNLIAVVSGRVRSCLRPGAEITVESQRRAANPPVGAHEQRRGDILCKRLQRRGWKCHAGMNRLSRDSSLRVGDGLITLRIKRRKESRPAVDSSTGIDFTDIARPHCLCVNRSVMPK
jgi:hypothetical protein